MNNISAPFRAGFHDAGSEVPKISALALTPLPRPCYRHMFALLRALILRAANLWLCLPG
jgi:hypothetical protein